jgi:hypothetical protein
MEKTGVYALTKNADHRRDGFKCLTIVEKDQDNSSFHKKKNRKQS